MMNCPKCGADISDSFQEAEPDVGVGAGWYCDACDLGVADEDGPEHHDDDVDIFLSGAQRVADRHLDASSLCKYCGTPLEMGYGLAGGGIGPYMYCPAARCGKTLIKHKDPT